MPLKKLPTPPTNYKVLRLNSVKVTLKRDTIAMISFKLKILKLMPSTPKEESSSYSNVRL